MRDEGLEAISEARDPQSFVRSLARGLAVIEALGLPPGRHTLGELAKVSGLNRAAARRVLLTLSELGYCEAEGRYFKLTPRTLGLGLSYLRSLPFWGYAQQALEELRVEVGESCAMAVLDGHDILYIHRLPARRILPTNLGIGSRLPAHAISLGRVLLAGLEQSELEGYLATAKRRKFTSQTLVETQALREELLRVGEQGFSWVEGELDPAIAGMSVPVRDHSSRIVAAISVNFISGTLDQPAAKIRFLTPLRKAAQEIRAHIEIRPY